MILEVFKNLINSRKDVNILFEKEKLMDDLNMNEKITKALKFYNNAISLKEKIRSGWLQWNIESERIESVAEHIYGTIMLAISLHSELYNDENLDIDKVIKMLAIHEIEEIKIGDITPFDNITDEEKRKMGKIAVSEICNVLELGNDYIDVIEEFEKAETKEAKFARMCDKLEANLQSKKYDEEGKFDLEKEENKVRLEDERIKKMSKNGINTVSGYFIENDMNKYDDKFASVAKFIRDNKIKDIK